LSKGRRANIDNKMKQDKKELLQKLKILDGDISSKGNQKICWLMKKLSGNRDAMINGC
jgi:hypothetical protein